MCVSRNWTLRNWRTESFVVRRNVNGKPFETTGKYVRNEIGEERKKEKCDCSKIYLISVTIVCVVSTGSYRAIACIFVRLIFLNLVQTKHTNAWKRWSAIGKRDRDRSVCVYLCATCKYRMTSIMSICWRWQLARLATTLNYWSNASIIQPTSSSTATRKKERKKAEEKWQKVPRDRDEIPIVWQNKFNPIKWWYKIQIMPTINLRKKFIFFLLFYLLHVSIAVVDFLFIRLQQP